MLCVSQQTSHWVETLEAGAGDVEVALPDIVDVPLDFGGPVRCAVVYTVDHEGEHFSHVSDYEFELWYNVEEPRGEEAAYVKAYVGMPRPCRGRKAERDCRVPITIAHCLLDGLDGESWV